MCHEPLAIQQFALSSQFGHLRVLPAGCARMKRQLTAFCPAALHPAIRFSQKFQFEPRRFNCSGHNLAQKTLCDEAPRMAASRPSRTSEWLRFYLESRHSLVTKHRTIEICRQRSFKPSKYVVAFFGFPHCFVLVFG